MKTCSDCHYFKNCSDSSSGECWRFPPQIIAETNCWLGMSLGSFQAKTEHPKVKTHDYCGEFKIRTTLKDKGKGRYD